MTVQKISACAAYVFLLLSLAMLSLYVISTDTQPQKDRREAANEFLSTLSEQDFEAAVYFAQARADITRLDGDYYFWYDGEMFCRSGNTFFKVLSSENFVPAEFAQSRAETCLSLLSELFIPEQAEESEVYGGLLTEYRTENESFFVGGFGVKRIEFSDATVVFVRVGAGVSVTFPSEGGTPLEPIEPEEPEDPEEPVEPEEPTEPIEPEEPEEPHEPEPEEPHEPEEPEERLMPAEFLREFLEAQAEYFYAKISSQYYSVHLRRGGEGYYFENLDTGYIEIFENGIKTTYNDDGGLVTNYNAVSYYYTAYLGYLADAVQEGEISAEYREDNTLSAVTAQAGGFSIIVYADENECAARIEVFSGGVAVYEIVYFSVGNNG